MKRIDSDKVTGTSYKGKFKANYEDLIEAFGESDGASGDDKCQANWTLEIDDIICTIYDWKEYDKELENITDWYIGGFTSEAETKVKEYLKL